MISRLVCIGLLFLLPQVSLAIDTHVVRSGEWEASEAFWQAFEAYEKQKAQKSDSQIRKNLERLQDISLNQEESSRQTEIQSLKKAISYYQQAINKQSDALRDGTLQLRLGHSYFQLCQKHEVEHNSCTHAIQALRQAVKETPPNRNKQAAMYLRSLLYERMHSKELATKSWNQLISQKKKDRYTFYAYLARGDDDFEQEKPRKAYQSYLKAYQLASQLKNLSSVDRTRSQYRFLWSSYRAGQLKHTVEAATAILSPGQSFDSEINRIGIVKDAKELLGDTLYEIGDEDLQLRVLQKPLLQKSITDVAIRLLQRLHNQKQWTLAEKIAKVSKSQNSLSLNQPRLLNLIADVYQARQQTKKSIHILSELALFLPYKSLWRQKNRIHTKSLRNMEDLAESAAISVARWHYTRALGSQDAKSYQRAATFYKILIDYKPTDPRAQDWKLRWSHCQNFSENFTTALAGYRDILKSEDLSDESKEKAAYHMIKVREKQLQKSWQKVTETFQKQTVTPELRGNVQALENEALSFIKKFPESQHKTHALLAVASAYRDIQNIKKARHFWEQSLLTEAQTSQRGIAIQGILYSYLTKNMTIKIIETCGRFLRFEKWNQQNKGLKSELYQILATALIKQTKDDMEHGRYQAGAKRIDNYLEEFKNLPKRQHFARDVAYLNALAGNWKEAEKVAHAFITQYKKSKHLADMHYIKARSQEYRFHFTDAAKSYQFYLQKYPTHQHAKASIPRAVKLAVSDSNYKLAAHILLENMHHKKGSTQKIKDCHQATHWFLESGAIDLSLESIKTCLNMSSTRSQILKSRSLQVNIQLTHQSRGSRKALESLAKDIQSSKSFLSKQDFAKLTAESQLHIGTLFKKKFHSIDIQSHPDEMRHYVEEKTKLFQKAVEAFQIASKQHISPDSSQANYEIGEMSDDLANEIAMVQIYKKRVRSLKEEQRFHRQIKRLQTMARKWHSHNILQRSRQPGLYQDDPWVRKSSLALHGAKAPKKDKKHQNIQPFVAHYELPQQWIVQ